jgi:hypothetical protein
MALIARCLGIVGLLCAVIACKGGPSSPSVSNAPNPSSTTVTLTTSKGGPLYDLPVTLSTGVVNGSPTGVIRVQRTDTAGQAIFISLPSSGQLCVSSVTEAGGTVYRTSHCAQPFPASYRLEFGAHVP